MGIIINQVREILPELTEKFPSVQVFYLFGSQATNTATEASDVDVAVYIDEKEYRANPLLDLEIGLFLENKIKRRVDVVVMQKASPILQHQILAGSVRLFERSHDFRARMELLSFKHYVDSMHYQNKRLQGYHG